MHSLEAECFGGGKEREGEREEVANDQKRLKYYFEIQIEFNKHYPHLWFFFGNGFENVW